MNIYSSVDGNNIDLLYKECEAIATVMEQFECGDILLADDLEGAGHVWKFLRDDLGDMYPWIRCYVHLGEEYEHFISKLINEPKN